MQATQPAVVALSLQLQGEFVLQTFRPHIAMLLGVLPYGWMDGWMDG